MNFYLYICIDNFSIGTKWKAVVQCLLPLDFSYVWEEFISLIASLLIPCAINYFWQINLKYRRWEDTLMHLWLGLGNVQLELPALSWSLVFIVLNIWNEGWHQDCPQCYTQLQLCVFLSPTAGQRIALGLEQKYIQEEKSLVGTQVTSTPWNASEHGQCSSVGACWREALHGKWIMGFCSGGLHRNASPSALSWGMGKYHFFA